MSTTVQALVSQYTTSSAVKGFEALNDEQKSRVGAMCDYLQTLKPSAIEIEKDASCPDQISVKALDLAVPATHDVMRAIKSRQWVVDFIFRDNYVIVWLSRHDKPKVTNDSLCRVPTEDFAEFVDRHQQAFREMMQ